MGETKLASDLEVCQKREIDRLRAALRDLRIRAERAEAALAAALERQK